MTTTHAEIADALSRLREKQRQHDEIFNEALDTLVELCGTLGHQWEDKQYSEFLDLRRNSKCSGYTHTCSICGYDEWTEFTELPHTWRQTKGA